MNDWLRRLRPEDDPPRPVSSDQALARATAELGPGPVGWGVQVAVLMTEDILAQVPEHGGGPRPVETMRSAVEATVLLALRMLVGSELRDHPEIAPEAVDSNAVFVRRGIPLDRVLRGVRIGHAHLHRALILELDREPEEVRAAETHRISELLFTLADLQASKLAEEYVAERDRWQAGAEAGRRRLLDDLLAERPVDAEAAARTLGYDLRQYHRAFIIWSQTDASLIALRRAAATIAAAIGCDSWLAVPSAGSQLWMWAGWQSRPGPVNPVGTDQWVACGPVARDRQGLRRSHLGAAEAVRLSTGPWTSYETIRAAALATADPEHARWFVAEVLGPLAAHDERTRELRHTLQAYLRYGRSPQTAADQLHIARNTVTYRVKRAQDLLGRPLDTDSLNLRLALEIAATW